MEAPIPIPGDGRGEPEQNSKIFVGSMAFEAEENDVRRVFAKYGGCCFIVYMTRGGAESAIASLDEIRQDRMFVKADVRWAAGVRANFKLFVGCLPAGVTDEKIRPVFEKIGPVRDVFVHTQKNFAFVTMMTYESRCNNMSQLGNKNYVFDGQNRPMIVKYADTPEEKQQKKGPNMMQGYPPMPYAMDPSMIDPNMYAQYAASAVDPAAQQAQWGYSMMPMPGMPGMPPMGMPGMPPMGMQPQQSSAPSATIGTKDVYGPPGANLFVMYLPPNIGDVELFQMFAPFGTIKSARVNLDKATGTSRGFGFVSFENSKHAEVARAQMNGFQLGNKRLKVEIKTDRQKPY